MNESLLNSGLSKFYLNEVIRSITKSYKFSFCRAKITMSTAFHKYEKETKDQGVINALSMTPKI